MPRLQGTTGRLLILIRAERLFFSGVRVPRRLQRNRGRGVRPPSSGLWLRFLPVFHMGSPFAPGLGGGAAALALAPVPAE